MFRLILKNTLRKRLRTILTLFAVIVAIVAFGFLRTIVDAWYSGVKASSSHRLVVRNAVSLVTPLPISYKDKIKNLDNVTQVTYGNWFGGIYRSEKDFFPNFVVDVKSYLELYPEYVLTSQERDTFIKDRRGCIAGRKLAEQFGWKVGDIITLRGTIFPGEWQLIIRGIYKGRDKNVDETLLLFHWDYLNENLKRTRPWRADQVGFFIVGIKDPHNASEIIHEIDEMFKNSIAETLTETEKAFQMGFVFMTEAILNAIKLVSYVIIMIILGVTTNTMSMSVRERTWEYMTLKAIGFGGRHILILILGESLLITLIGGIAGIILTFPAASIFVSKMGTLLPIFNIETETLLLDLVLSIIVGVVAGLFPLLRIMKLPVYEGLRRVA